MALPALFLQYREHICIVIDVSVVECENDRRLIAVLRILIREKVGVSVGIQDIHLRGKILRTDEQIHIRTVRLVHDKMVHKHHGGMMSESGRDRDRDRAPAQVRVPGPVRARAPQYP